MEISVEKSFDLSYLNQIFGCNQELVKNVITMFLAEMPSYINQLKQSCVVSDFEVMQAVAHKSKSSVAMLGLTSMENKLVMLERIAKTRANVDVVPELISSLHTESENAFDQLKEEIKEAEK